MSKADELKLNARELQLKMLFDEQEKRIAELEMTVGTLRTFSNEQSTSIEELEKKNAELKEYNKYLRRKRQGGIQKQYNKVAIIKQQAEQLTKAKDLIENIIRVTWGEGWSYSLDWKVKAEQFLKE